MPGLFNVARLINAAVMAKIHTVEWTPAILPNRGLDSGLNANWYGLFTTYRAPEKRKTVADINVRNPEMGGVVGNPINKHGQPYGLTEEFVEVYRLHSLLPETIGIRSAPQPRIGGRRAVCRDPPGGVGETDRQNFNDRPVLLVWRSASGATGAEQLSQLHAGIEHTRATRCSTWERSDILRARERGVPRYNEFRRSIGS